MLNRLKKFTLIELLVVVAIIGILASFLIPTLGRARESARSILCLNNLKQITLAINMYDYDDEDVMPQMDKIDRFLIVNNRGGEGDQKSLWNCPSAGDGDGVVTEEEPICYTFSLNSLSWVGKKKITDIVNASSTLILTDGRMNMPWGSWIFMDPWYGLSGYHNWETPNSANKEDTVYVAEADVDGAGSPSGTRYLHNGNKTTNAGFFDGHATAVKRYGFNKGNFISAW